MYHPKIQLLRILKESKRKSVGRSQTHTSLSVSPPIYDTQDKIMAKILLGLIHVTALVSQLAGMGTKAVKKLLSGITDHKCQCDQ